MSDLAKLVKPLAHAAPTVARALDEAPELAHKALAEAAEAKPEEVHTALMGLPIGGIITVLGLAENILRPILAPPEMEQVPAQPVQAAKPPPGSLDQALGGEKLTGWKTVIGIVAGGVLYAAYALGVAPAVLTPEVVQALAGLIASWTGIGLLAKLDRVMSWVRPAR